MNEESKAFEERFIPEPNSGCWLWIGMQQVGKEYGLFCFKQKTRKAHRAAWNIYCGAIPPGLHVLHKCDNPPCVNPDHLFLGTHQDNMRDMTNKGRAVGPKGEQCHLARMTEEQVREIRRLKEAGYTAWALAGIFGVDRTQIWKIVRRKTWKHV
jgi:hypothetical protein